MQHIAQIHTPNFQAGVHQKSYSPAATQPFSYLGKFTKGTLRIHLHAHTYGAYLRMWHVGKQKSSRRTNKLMLRVKRKYSGYAHM